MQSCKSPTESHYTITKRYVINYHNLKLRYPKRNASTECSYQHQTENVSKKAGLLSFLNTKILISKYFSTLRKTILGGNMKSRDKRIIGITFHQSGPSL